MGVFHRTLAAICGWRMQFFDACSSLAGQGKVLVDRGSKRIFIHTDLLRLPLKSAIALCRQIRSLVGDSCYEGWKGHRQLFL